MVTAIDFAVRSSAGGRQLGTVAGEGQGNFIQVGAGDSVSLNLSPASIVAYEQQGRDLVIKLADGRVVVLSGYFDPTDGAAHLYLSTNDQITEVFLSGDGTGVLMANYGPAQQMEKWSPLDDLRFAGADGVVDGSDVSDEPAGMGLFAPALLGGLGSAGAVGAGVLGLGLLGAGGGGGGGATGAGTLPSGGDGTGSGSGGGNGSAGDGSGGNTGGNGNGGNTGGNGNGGNTGGNGGGGGGTDTTPGGGDGGNTRVPPTVDEPNRSETLTSNTVNPVIEVTGTGEPGDSVVVTVGYQIQTTIIGSDSTWGVDFEGDELPADGSYSSVVVVTEPGGTEHVLDGPDYVIDMTPPPVSVTEGTESVGDIENLADYQDGVTIAGEGEIGAAIRIEVDGLTRETVVDANGNWSFNFTQTEIGGGERSVDVRITATDPLGNVTVLTDRLVIDTVPHPVAINPVTENNLVNEREYDAGFTMTGSTSPNTSVTLVINAGGQSVTRTFTSDASGNWQQEFLPGALPEGTYEATATLSTVDSAGNPSSITRTFNVDTEVNVAFGPLPIAGDDIVNAVEASGAITMSGTSAPGSVVTVDWAGQTVPAVSQPDGSWTATFPAGTVTSGTYPTTATVTATDSANNSHSATRTILVDTEISVGIDDNQTGDNRISGTERDAGFAFTGTGEPGAVLSVSITTPGGTVTHPATVNAQGNWSVSYQPGELPSGTYTATVSVSARDAAGNTTTDTHTVRVDTETSVSILPLQAGDNYISAAERTAGITLTGTAEPDAVLSVTFNSVTYSDIRANSAGAWSVPVSTAGIPSGTTTATVSVVATDGFGNTAQASHVVNIDTEVVPLTRSTLSTGNDNVLNNVEAGRGLTVTGTVEAGSVVNVSFDGKTAHRALVSGTTWSVTIPASDIPPGTTSGELLVTATDRFGNSGQHREMVAIDREVTPLEPGQQVLAGDGYLNASEAAQGLTVTGLAEPNSVVTVQMMVGDQIFGTPIRLSPDQPGIGPPRSRATTFHAES